MTLIERLKDFTSNEAISMHVPGHKNNTIGDLNDLLTFNFDMTEIKGLDNLHDPVEVLKDLNSFLSNKAPGYLAQAMVNGTTNGIMSAIFALSKKCQTFVLYGDIHKSIFHALDLVSVSYEILTKEELFNYDYSDKALIITSPNYEGNILENISSLVSYVHDKNGYILVDAAHGAHLSITENFPEAAYLSKADIIVESYHKMLPALTMASVIFVKEERLYNEVMTFINYFETSSPSYLIMASIESAQQFYNNYKDGLFFKRRKKLIEHLNQQGISVKEADDPCKLLLNWQHGPYALEDSLINENIYAEMTTDSGVLFVLPLWHEGDCYPYSQLLDRLERLCLIKNENNQDKDISNLLGKVCVQNVVPYPPGIPLVLKGEIFTEADLKQLQQYLFNHVKIEGIDYNINYYV